MVGDRQVQLSIAIEVADCNGPRAAAHSVSLGCSEGPIAVAEEHRDVVGIKVGDHQVWLAIAIEVAHSHKICTAASVTEAQGPLECPIAIPQQHRNGVGSLSARTVV